MNYLIDTCVFSEYKKPYPNQEVLDWLDRQPNESLYVSVLTFGELEKGIIRMPESVRKKNLKIFLVQLIEQFGSRTLDLNIATVRRWAALMASLETKGRPLPMIDSLIAATALENDLTIVTRNEDDFAATGAKVLNIWK